MRKTVNDHGSVAPATRPSTSCSEVADEGCQKRKLARVPRDYRYSIGVSCFTSSSRLNRILSILLLHKIDHAENSAQMGQSHVLLGPVLGDIL